eukprot:746888-Hanusia_phi.AAC.5
MSEGNDGVRAGQALLRPVASSQSLPASTTLVLYIFTQNSSTEWLCPPADTRSLCTEVSSRAPVSHLAPVTLARASGTGSASCSPIPRSTCVAMLRAQSQPLPEGAFALEVRRISEASGTALSSKGVAMTSITPVRTTPLRHCSHPRHRSGLLQSQISQRTGTSRKTAHRGRVVVEVFDAVLARQGDLDHSET